MHRQAGAIAGGDKHFVLLRFGRAMSTFDLLRHFRARYFAMLMFSRLPAQEMHRQERCMKHCLTKRDFYLKHLLSRASTLFHRCAQNT